MSNNPAHGSQHNASTTARPRRALIIAETAGLSLQQQLTAAGYVTRAAAPPDAERAINDFGPEVVIMVVTHTGADGESESVALARKLRAETSTYSLPIVFAWSEDERSLRAAAQYTGADDYFALATPTAEVLARLDSLFWRVEADRRSAPVLSDRRLEIDNFMFMLDAVREDVRSGRKGTLALIYAVAAGGKREDFDRQARDQTLAEVHAFLKLNLRRVDAVAFYGPTTLLVYLPRMESSSAVAALSRLHREFLEEYPEHDFATGLASFPAHGSEVETLIERAESAVGAARAGDLKAKHVAAYEAKENAEPQEVSPPPPSTEFQLEPEISEEAKEPAAQSEPASAINSKSVDERRGKGEPGDRATVSAQDSEASSSGARATQTTAEEAAALERERRASGAVMPRRLLLTISDSALMAQVNSLIRSAGYEARAAFDGQQALHLLRIESPDLLLLDYELQGIDGVETIRRLRKQSGGRLALPVVMLISNGNEQARREALELGARSVLVTPYDPADLLASVRVAGSPQ
ncbi:MAG TPA: response regulator [Pyrinomonadaceae bacterium]|nr:response regulator [Pyrinomonadaceae bacterium]